MHRTMTISFMFSFETHQNNSSHPRRAFLRAKCCRSEFLFESTLPPQAFRTIGLQRILSSDHRIQNMIKMSKIMPIRNRSLSPRSTAKFSCIYTHFFRLNVHNGEALDEYCYNPVNIAGFYTASDGYIEIIGYCLNEYILLFCI